MKVSLTIYVPERCSGHFKPKVHTSLLFLQSAVVVAVFIGSVSDSPAAKERVEEERIWVSFPSQAMKQSTKNF